MTTMVGTMQASSAEPATDLGAGIAVVDPGLFFECGHHATLARMLVAEGACRGWPTAVFGTHRMDHAPQGLAVRRHFAVSAYANLRGAADQELRRTNDATLADARRLPLEELAGYAVVLVPTLTARVALGLARWAAELPMSFVPRLAMVLMFQPGWGADGAQAEAERAVYREAFAVLAGLPSGRVALFAETAPMARLFESLGAPGIRVLPWPVKLGDPCEPGVWPEGEGPARVAYLGDAKPERGLNLLPGVVRSVAATHPGTRFAVQGHWWAGTPHSADAERVFAELNAMGPALRVLPGELSPDVYASVLRGSDIVLMPYEADGYRDRGSGVFAEAAAAGRVMVLPSGTWMAEEAARWSLGFTTFDQFDAAGVGRALSDAVAQKGTLLARANAAAPAWRADRSARRFVDRLMEAAAAVRIEIKPLPSAPRPPASNVEGEDAFTDKGLWTPQTQMLRAVRDWVCGSADEPRTALSIDRNPTLNQILLSRWPGLEIREARYPQFDVQDLSGIPDGCFDLVYSHQVLEHVPKPWRAAAELVRVVRPGGLGIHTTCAANPRHGLPEFNDYYRFLPDGLGELFDGVEVLVKAGWGNRQALLYNYAIDDGHGALGGRRFVRAVGEPNEENHPWHTWIIFRRR